MIFNELSTVNFYDSTLSDKSSLLVSSKNGLLTFFPSNYQTKETKIKIDMNQKKINFYPDDEILFTSTDSESLKIWDLENQKIIFKYPNDIIINHLILKNKNIVTLTEIGLKFYDLRMRYSNSFFECKNIKNIFINKNKLFYLKNDSIFEFSDKNKLIYKSKNILNFKNNVILKKDSLFFLEYEIEKKHKADQICNFNFYDNENLLISTFGGNKINFLSKNKDFEENFNFQKIESVIGNEKIIFLFADGKLFKSEDKIIF